MSSSDLDNNHNSIIDGVDDDYFGSDYEYDSSSDGRYSEESDHAHQPTSLFNQEPATCPICCDDKVEEGCALTLPSCSHSFCVDCFTRYVEMQIGQGNADNVTCPFIIDCDDNSTIGKQCNAPVGMDVLHEIMTQESFDKLKYQKDAAFVRKNVDYHHCPSPDCTNIVLCKSIDVDDDIMNAEQVVNASPRVSARICDCFKCGNTSCLTCGAVPFHDNKTCEEYREEKQRLKSQREQFLQLQFQQMGRHYRHSQPDRGRVNEKANYNFNIEPNSSSDDALQGIKRCRRCGNGVERQSGCLKMKCLCGYRFCYQCGSENAQCDCTPSHHGFIDNATGGGDFSGLGEAKSYT